MEYKKITCDNYNLHLIKNNRFHTIDLKIFFTENVSKELITYRNVLIDILIHSTKKYSTRKALYRKSQSLYSISPVASSMRYGNYLCTKFGISILNSMYINQDNIYENIDLLKEIVLNPLVENKSFNDKNLDVIKDALKAETETICEDPRLYANISMLELMGKKENYNLTGYSDIEILKEVNGKNLYKSYLDMLKKSKIDIFIAGNIKDVDKIIKKIQNTFNFKNQYNLVNPINIHSLKRKEYQFFCEKKDYLQSKISIGCKLYNLTEFEFKYVLPLFCGLLGSDSNSLLMQEVREKNSLCYYITSYINKLDNILVINSAMKKENYEKVIQIVQETLNLIKQGKFTKKKIYASKKEYITEINSFKNSNNGYIEYILGREIFKTDELKTRIKMIKKITKEDIINVANKMLIDTIFYLEGNL